MNPQDAPAQQVLTLPGAIALSAFRVEKLLASLPGRAAKAAIDTRFVHFAAIAGPLDARETQVLEKLLTYGTPARGEPRAQVVRQLQCRRCCHSHTKVIPTLAAVKLRALI